MRVMGARRAGLIASLALTAAACGSSGSATPVPSTAASAGAPTSAPAQSPAPSSAPTPAPSKGPASAQFALIGSAGLTGAVTTTEIFCDQPTLAGPEIEALGKAGTNGPDFVLFVTANHIEARVGTGSAQTLKLRTFVGSGVTSFDSATGVQLDSALTESTAPGTAIGNLGTLSRISGKLDCGNEQAGTSTIAISGTSTLGPMSGILTPFRVVCTVTAGATYVGLQGIGTAGSTPVLVFVTASTGMVTVFVETSSVGTQYSAKGAGVDTLTTGGAQISADVTETKGGVGAHTLHVEGTDGCGTIVNQ
jgi:hypothetical protein